MAPSERTDGSGRNERPRFEREVDVLRSVVDRMPDGLVVADADGKFLYFNAAAEAILGRGPASLDPADWAEAYGCFLPDGETRFPAGELPLARALRGEETTDVEILIRGGAKPDAVIQVSGRPMLCPEGSVCGGIVTFRDITRLHRSMAKVRRLSAAIERTGDCVFITDRDGVIRYVNPAFEQQTGFAADEICGKTPAVLNSGFHEAAFFASMWTTILSGDEFRAVIRNRRKDGSEFWGEQTITPIPGADGGVRSFVSLLRDVTERELALRRERDFNAAILSSTSALVLVTDARGELIRFNPACERVSEFSSEAVIGSKVADLPMVLVDRERWRECFDESLSREHGVSWELPWKTRSGRTAIVSWTFRGIRDDDGATTNVVGTGVDVTDSRAAHAALEESEQRYRTLVDNLHEGLWLIDENGRTTFVNERMAEMIGRRVDAILGRPIAEFTDAAGAARLEDSLRRRRAGITEDHEFDWFAEDGRRVSTIMQASPIFDRDGHYRGMLAGVLDITARIDQERAIRAAHDELEQRVEERTEELREALTELRGLKDQIEAENVVLREEVRRSRPQTHIIGEGRAIRKALAQVERVARTDSTVLLLGETGTGKGLFARAVHEHSPLSDRPLITVDCATLPDTLIESELFGHEKGAFTGATRTRPGRFELADGGTIFLDEIGDVPRGLQAKLLRILQSGEFERVGSGQTRRVEVRVIAATNRDLRSMVEGGRFRSDLYFRLSVFPIHVPPLRERVEDIPLLVRHFVERRGGAFARSIPVVPADVIDALCRHDWPGNVRELENTVERALITSTGGRLTLDDVLASIDDGPSRTRDDGKTLVERERSYIVRVLERCRWKIKGEGNAADVLGLAPSTLRDRMRRLDIERPRRRSPRRPPPHDLPGA